MLVMQIDRQLVPFRFTLRQYSFLKKGLLQIEWVIFVILRAIPVYDGDAIADW